MATKYSIRATTLTISLVASFLSSVALSTHVFGSLIGDQVTVGFRGQTSPTQVVTDTVLGNGSQEPLFAGLGGPELPVPGINPRWDVNFETSSIRVDFVSSGGASYGPGTTLDFLDLDWIGRVGEIISVFVLDEGGVPGFSMSDPGFLTFGPHSVNAQLALTSTGVVTWPEESFFVVGIETRHDVPEPSILFLLGIGTIGFLANARRKQRQAGLLT